MLPTVSGSIVDTADFAGDAALFAGLAADIAEVAAGFAEDAAGFAEDAAGFAEDAADFAGHSVIVGLDPTIFYTKDRVSRKKQAGAPLFSRNGKAKRSESEF